jgi:site-specific recombinase XerC
MRSAPTAKLRLAALRHLFDWMVIGQVMPTNPAAVVRGPRHVVRRGKTPELDPIEARRLIDAIDASTVIGLRDRALIGLMVYSFARIGATIGMRVEDVYTQNRRLWVRLHEKGARCTPCRVTTILNPICMRISTVQASRPIRRRFCSKATVAGLANSPATPCPRRTPTR